MKNKIYFLIIILHFNLTIVFAQNHTDIVVDQNGEGDYKTITEAINGLSMYPYQRTVIFIKNGIYEERIKIEKNYITLLGESRDSTIIRFNLPRDKWNKDKDWIGPGVVNIEADDIILENLTIANTQQDMGIHAFTIYGLNPNRTIIINCNVLSKGGDTVSLWNYKEGMYYHANCFFQGAVDFVCPRGWCFIKDSEFYQVRETAAIWHAGNYNPRQKFVLKNCSFDGVKNFELGRHHYQAQFYLMDCMFSENMKDKPIYKVLYDNPDRNNPDYAGNRIYFYNCKKEGNEFDWYQNNLYQAEEKLKSDKITAEWTFNGMWNPEANIPVFIADYTIEANSVIFTFSEIVSVRGNPHFETTSGKHLKIVKQRYNDINKLTFLSDGNILESDLERKLYLRSGDIIASMAYAQEKSIGKSFTIDKNLKKTMESNQLDELK